MAGTTPGDVGVLVIGTGFGARVVAPAYEAAEGGRVVGVVSARDDAQVRAAVVRDDVDLVSIHSPPFLHAQHVAWAQAAGKAVLCDKPLGRNGDDAAAIVAAAVPGLVAHVNLEFRLDPARVAMRDAVVDGLIGRIRHVAWVHHSAGTRHPMRRYGWLFDRALGGGWIGAWGSHAIDALAGLLGGLPEVVASHPQTLIAQRPDHDGVARRCTAEDTLSAILRGPDGVSIVLDSGFAMAADVAPRIVVHGDEGTIENVADRRVRLLRAGADPVVLFDAARTDAPVDRHVGPMHRLAARMVRAVEAGAADPALATLADGAAVDRVLDALRAG